MKVLVVIQFTISTAQRLSQTRAPERLNRIALNDTDKTTSLLFSRLGMFSTPSTVSSNTLRSSTMRGRPSSSKGKGPALSTRESAREAEEGVVQKEDVHDKARLESRAKRKATGRPSSSSCPSAHWRRRVAHSEPAAFTFTQ
eukprot:scaffold857_cov152-Ochromonas_danica.AAC.10